MHLVKAMSKKVFLYISCASLNMTNLFPNECIALRIFCCLPVSIAQAERSLFSVLSRVKNCLRSTMGQQRLTELGLLSIESKLVKNS
jgi:hypothetical protein